jgi:hypothetical protein
MQALCSFGSQTQAGASESTSHRNNMKIVKSQGQTPTENLLSALADRTFLKLWCYANPFKADGKELCDLIAVFENHIFLFFDRESRKFDSGDPNVPLTWRRWKREVVDRQIKTANGAKRYLSAPENLIYLDPACSAPFPLRLQSQGAVIHKIVVAHGAEEACKAFSDENVYGSLAVSYEDGPSESPWPFMVHLDRQDPIHLFDSHNLGIILGELDTITDFTKYISTKEKAIATYEMLSYCGEEDLLAHYLINYDRKRKEHLIGPIDETVNAVMIGEGDWKDFLESGTYARRKEADKPSYLWDEIIQRTCQNALDGTLLGHPLFDGASAIHEMAKEPRFIRRALSEKIIDAVRTFPENIAGIARKLTYLPSFEGGKAYVFLQLKNPNLTDFTSEWRPKRQELLHIACGAAKLNFPHLQKVVGIAIDAPKFANEAAEDFVLLDARNWTEEDQKFYRIQNDIWKFFETPYLRRHHGRITEFPGAERPSRPHIIGRNDKCPCGSGQKFKRCCASKGRRRSGTR